MNCPKCKFPFPTDYIECPRCGRTNPGRTFERIIKYATILTGLLGVLIAAHLWKAVPKPGETEKMIPRPASTPKPWQTPPPEPSGPRFWQWTPEK